MDLGRNGDIFDLPKTLSREEYKKAEGLLKRYKYNGFIIVTTRDDLIGGRSASYDGMPKAPYNISDTTYKQVEHVQNNEPLQKAITERKIVDRVVRSLSRDESKFFNLVYNLEEDKALICETLKISPETYKRRKRKIVYRVWSIL